MNEDFFDNLRVPVENLDGEENKGWDYAKFLLGNERFSEASVSISKERIRLAKHLAAESEVGNGRLIDQPWFREKVTAVEVELKALEITQLRVLASASAREKRTADPASSILKLKGSEIEQAAAELLLEAAGPYAIQDVSEDEEGSALLPSWSATSRPSGQGGSAADVWSSRMHENQDERAYCRM